MKNKLIHRFDPFSLSYIDSLPEELLELLTKKYKNNKNLAFLNFTKKSPPKGTDKIWPFYSIQKDKWYMRDISLKTNQIEDFSHPGVGIVNNNLNVSKICEEIFIIDEFYKNPQEVRNEALKDNYNIWSEFDSYRTGRRTNEFVVKSISECMRLNFCEAQYSLSGTYKYNISDDSWKRNFIHYDLVGDYAAVLFLNDVDAPGLNFYEHLETGFCNAKDLGSDKKFKHKIFYDGFFSERWRITKQIPFKFNRLCVFKASLFHREAVFFGESIKNARLTQNFFFKEKN